MDRPKPIISRPKTADLPLSSTGSGHIDRTVTPTCFGRAPGHRAADFHKSTGDHLAKRMQDALGTLVNCRQHAAAGVPLLQSLGMTFRKAEYITDFAEKICSGAFNLESVKPYERRGWQSAHSVRLRYRRMDCREMILLFFACSGRTCSAMICDPARTAHGISPPQN